MNIKKVDFDADGSKGPPVIRPCDLCCLRPSKCGHGEYCLAGYYTLVSEEPEKTQAHSMQDIKLKFVIKPTGERCSICAFDYDNCSTQCGDRGYFEIATEKPGKIQTDYEWMKERLELIQIQESINYTPDEFQALAKEENELLEWLKDNQPEDWQICTKENTKTGDVVRFKNTGELREFEHICNDGQVILYNDAQNKSFPVLKLENYEINLAEKSDCLPSGEC